MTTIMVEAEDDVIKSLHYLLRILVERKEN